MFRAASILLIVVLASASIAVRREAERNDSRISFPEARYPLPPEYLRIAALSHDSLVADLMWIRFIQQVPLRPADDEFGRSLASQLDAIVRLDPGFKSAYNQGSILLSVLGGQPCAALSILERAMERFPDDWTLPFQAGYNCFVELGDPACGAKHMKRAASLRDSPPWLPALAARLMADADEHEAAIDYLRIQLRTTTDPALRQRFQERLGEAVLRRDLGTINEAASRFRRREGRMAASLDELRRAGLLAAEFPAMDPFGGTYRLRTDGRAESSSGREPHGAFTSHGAFLKTIGERLFAERVQGRIREALGKPYWIRTGLDHVAGAGEDLAATLQALETVAALDLDAARLEEIRVAEARVLLRLEMDRLREAHLALLRERPDRPPTIEEIRARAGVAATEPFGDPFQLGPDGAPIAPRGRNPMVAVRSATGSNACR